jgi:D-alanyl-D-alanine carboxypeptidase
MAANISARLCLFAALSVVAFAGPAGTADAVELRAQIDAIVKTALKRTGTPSASIALVRDRTLIYSHAYGWGRLDPPQEATPAMRYAIGSISKEFTAAALLFLQERGLLSIDDPAGRYIPNLGPAAEVTIRALLSHTGGVRDWWPQDYCRPQILHPVHPEQIVAAWANRPLDFPPNSDWRYSNTGYTIAGLIAEHIAHEPLFEQLRTRIFAPLRMTSAFDMSIHPLSTSDAVGYTHYALGLPRVAPKEGAGWLFGMGQLAMTASDLARWDIALMEHRLLNEGSYRDFTQEVRLTNGAGTEYALGLQVLLESGRRVWKHGGAVSGFTAHNRVYPDDGDAIIVLVNGEGSVSTSIADQLSRLLLTERSAHESAADAEAKRIFADLQRGRIERERLTSNARSYFTAQALSDFSASLGPLGDPNEFTLARSYRRGGLIIRTYDVACADRKLTVVMENTLEGQIEQYTVTAD